MAKTDQEYERRIRAVELAIGHHTYKEGDMLTTAAAIYAFAAGGEAEARPTSTPTPTPTPSADAGGQASGANSASPAPSTTADETVDGAGGENQQDAFDGDVSKLTAKCTALAQRDGPGKLLEAFKSVGASKWSEVPESKYADLYATITAAGI